MGKAWGMVVMLGTDFTAPGGISSVLSSYRAAGLFSDGKVRFIPTYTSAGALAKLGAAVRALGQVLGLALQPGIGVVHVHSASRGSFWRKAVFLVLGRMFGARTIFHLHSGEFPVFYHDECGAFAKGVVRWVLRHSDRVVVLTQGWVAAIQAIEPAVKVVVLGNPVEVPAQVGGARARREQEVLFLGRLREKKGVFDLISAFGKVADAFPDARLVLAGDGDAGPIMAAAKRAGVAERVDVPGWVEGARKAALLERAAVFVLPSYFEGLPIGVLEAMAHACPVIASRVGGIPDVIVHGQDGWLFEAGDETTLAGLLRLALGDRDVAAQVGAHAREVVRARFEQGEVTAGLRALYAELEGQVQ